ncbi:class I adenylate-forming enzyme family protein [Pseudoalteromonas sp. Of7M-16]|uniref:class I adenylate-forming enzyme family protein n=1 Tax=Pseudoalteromonas sp. Of7M-16 TaxID=2917756 RepID=UPI001EF5D77F|nr:class I adenylate-forming enzyme family protein [Pseudoalteromonas sp. Of7M-16]MCG7549860.1 acyl--CoA ligase [Pseudoalteromonas sp. Of7M-16]
MSQNSQRVELNMDGIYPIFKRRVLAAPDKTAVIFKHTYLTYRDLDQKVCQLAAYFEHIGLNSGHRIALFAPNGIEYPVVLLAAAKIGLAVVPLPISLKGTALEVALKKTPVAAVLSWPSISKILLEKDLIEKDKLISFEKSVAGEITWQEVFERQTPLSPSTQQLPQQVDVNAPFILTMTSGSTGTPKPIVLSQYCKIMRAIEATQNYYGLDENDKVLVATPLYHSLAQRGVLMPLMLGATTVIMAKFALQGWLDAIETHRISFLFAVSAQLESFLAYQGPVFNLSSLRCLVSSSAVLNAESKRALLSRLQCAFHECYGASEVGVVTDFCVSDSPEKNGSVGRPLPFVNVKICSEVGQPVQQGVVGEIACKTLTGFSGYHKMPDATEAAYDKEGYFYTGDLGYLDESGYLYYVGRKKEVISSGGINIFPQDIEAVIKRHPDVIDCVAFGVDEPQLGEIIKVVYEQQGEASIDRALRLMCLQELTDYQQPRTFVRLSELPRNQMGKVLRNDVKLQNQ